MAEVTEQDRAVTVKEAAGILGCAEITVKRALDKDLPSFKIGDGNGRARRISLSDLRA